MPGFRLSIISILAIGAAAPQKQWKDYIQECRHSDSSCYKFLDREESWNSAKQYCNGKEWKLVEIEVFDELLFLQEKIREHFGINADKLIEFWTAGYYKKNEGDWIWDHSHQPIQFISWRNGKQVTMWAPPEPNSRHTEDCIGLYNREDYYMNDDDCNAQRFFICEGKDESDIDEHIVG